MIGSNSVVRHNYDIHKTPSREYYQALRDMVNEGAPDEDTDVQADGPVEEVPAEE